MFSLKKTGILVSNLFTLWNAVDQVRKVMNKSNPSRQISSAVENMLKTGRLVTQSGLDLQQVLACSDSILLFSI